MKIVQHGKKRKAISPVLATVILIAITLIAAIAVAGFVFGLFGSFTNTAQISATSINIPASLTGTAIAVASCGPVAGASNIVLSNSGTSSATANTMTITYAGVTYSATLPAACTIGASGSATAAQGIVLTHAGLVPAPAGTEFTGSISLSNGGVVQFTGSFR
jgi:flagellin-like protein